MKYIFIIFLFLNTCLLSAQELLGTVETLGGNTLEGANVLAQALDSSTGLKFSITDAKGYYKLVLEPKTNYQIKVSYLGFQSDSLVYNYEKPIKEHKFILRPSEESLEEIVLNYSYAPVVMKKDTIIYRVSAFTDGTEKKLKDQLKKLPGVEVTNEGGVTVNGKSVTHFMVESNEFFGGGTKLGVENIPADAVEEVEVIDHFTEVGHMKDVLSSDELAMNILLKENKKKFIFGDIKAGFGNHKYYETHSNLFYYSPEVNFGFITNLNNYGSELLTFDDLIRFQEKESLFLRNSKNQIIDLYSMMLPNTDVYKNKTQFSALDFAYLKNPKWKVNSLFLFNKNWLENKINQEIQYLQTDEITDIDKEYESQSKKTLLYGKITNRYSFNNQTTFKHNLQVSGTQNLSESETRQTHLSEVDFISNISDVDNFTFNQLAEFHKTFNARNKFSVAASQTYQNKTPDKEWYSNSAFFDQYIPWEAMDTYSLKRIESFKEHKLKVNAKHYWIPLRKHHFYTSLGYNADFTRINSSSYADVNEEKLNLLAYGFGNILDYKTHNLYFGVEHKFTHKKFSSTIGVFPMLYKWQNTSLNSALKTTKYVIEPEINLKYDMGIGKSIIANYNIKYSLPSAYYLMDGWDIEAYDMLFRGHSLIKDTKYHNFRLLFSHSSIASNAYTYNAGITYSRNNKSIHSRVLFEGTDRLFESFMMNKPVSRFGANFSLSRSFKDINFRFSSQVSQNSYTQFIDNISYSSKRNSQSFSLTAFSLFENSPNFRISYSKSYTQLNSNYKTQSNSDRLSLTFDTKFLKNFTSKIEYRLSRTSFLGEKEYKQQAHTYIEYQKENSNWSFILSANNIFNESQIKDITFTDYLISNSNTYVLPRAVLFSIQYKL